MIKKLFTALFGLVCGIGIGYYAIFYTSLLVSSNPNLTFFNPLVMEFGKREVIGFLPYWLLTKSDKEYKNYITNLTYFGLTIDDDGTILKKNNPQESEPGWFALKSGKVDSILANAKKNNISISLLVFNANNDSIRKIINEPKVNAGNLLKDIVPLMKQYGFTDLNLDFESTKEASDSERMKFGQFVGYLKQGLTKEKVGTLTVDLSAIDFVKKNLIDPFLVGTIADRLVVMAYDYHYIGSNVTGAVAPLSGAGSVLEFDTKSAIEKALEILPSTKIILGLPLYGYEWETINNTPQSAVIPGTGKVASNSRIEELFANCASCSAVYNSTTEESALIYKDVVTQSYHQLNYPDEKSMRAKLKYASSKKLGGVALWALGYEGSTILSPLSDYKKNSSFLLH